ncbi:DUF998 domain-containing protein [Streptomyces sp. NBC_00193]|uniref:DUF998 domain-containing protein n=1 Tax=unclassified Streptomyces TaxID=2593676 RepID=UPI0022552E0F|nr:MULTISPECIES: DUF998 domain-containing protein [unclassified Streptomyces]MCX5129975.1 DUF998 domain-containing protein [Streptomyces sp. NBC_00347]MCX5300349.1 DUF998 domain-containing protein [Streptomyces sp. NBC_00193]
MTATNTASAAGVRAPLTLIGIGALAMAALETLNPEYDLVSETLSRYVHGTAGWLLPAALLAVGAASTVLAVRLGAGTRRAGRAALVVWTAGIVVAALFPADPPGHWSSPSLSELVHGNAAFLAFAALPTAAVLLRGTLAARRPGLRTALSTLTVASVTATAALTVFLVDVMDGGPSLGLGGAPTLVGLVERLVIAADFGWIALAIAAAGARKQQGRDRRA